LRTSWFFVFFGLPEKRRKTNSTKNMCKAPGCRMISGSQKPHQVFLSAFLCKIEFCVLSRKPGAGQGLRPLWFFVFFVFVFLCCNILRLGIFCFGQETRCRTWFLDVVLFRFWFCFLLFAKFSVLVFVVLSRKPGARQGLRTLGFFVLFVFFGFWQN